MSETDIPVARVMEKRSFSFVWVIPFLAVVIGAWLLNTYYHERGVFIDVSFAKAAGIEKNKTKVKFKDVEVGKVKDITISDDLDYVHVTLNIYPSMEDHLGTNTKFWVVRPKIGIRGVSGIQTLLSGVYIEMDPDLEGDLTDEFIGQSEVPAISSGSDGTIVMLETEELNGLDEGSPVYYKGIDVGEVSDYKYNTYKNKIVLRAFIRKPYDTMVHKNTSFWNASGVDVEFAGFEFKAHVTSLTSALIGGVSFDNFATDLGDKANNHTSFTLSENAKVAKNDANKEGALKYMFVFSDNMHNLKSGAPIELNGFKVGEVTQVILQRIDEKKGSVNSVVMGRIDVSNFVNEQADEVEKKLQRLVKQGLRARLTEASLLSRTKYISLEPQAVTTGKSGMLAATSYLKPSMFPSTSSAGSLLDLNLDPVLSELQKTLNETKKLIGSTDVKDTLRHVNELTASLANISRDLDKRGIGGELTKTLKELQSTTVALRKTAQSIDQGVSSTLKEDSALQYRLQMLMNELSEAAGSFSVLADTLQRKPNSVIFGK